MREFETGANRDDDHNKVDYEGSLSPLVLHRYAGYIKSKRKIEDGTIRLDDNWKKGFPIESYMKSKWRHFMATWLHYSKRSDLSGCKGIEESLCAELFNTMGMLHEILKGKTTNSSPDLVFYPHYCFDCHRPFLSKDELSRCPYCNGVETVNHKRQCYGEEMECLECTNAKPESTENPVEKLDKSRSVIPSSGHTPVLGISAGIATTTEKEGQK